MFDKFIDYQTGPRIHTRFHLKTTHKNVLVNS